MYYYIEDYNQHVEITGYKSIKFLTAETFLKAERFQKKLSVSVQFFDADFIATYEHLYFASINAFNAFKTNTNHSKSLPMEIMLYASGQTQINKAIAKFGVKEMTKNMAVTIVGQNIEHINSVLSRLSEHLGKAPDESVLKMKSQKEKKIINAYGITNQEIAASTRNNDKSRAIIDIVIERTALLSTL